MGYDTYVLLRYLTFSEKNVKIAIDNHEQFNSRLVSSSHETIQISDHSKKYCSLHIILQHICIEM